MAVRELDYEGCGQVELPAFSFFIFLIHDGFPALCPNKASPILKPAAVKHSITHPFLWEMGKGGEMSTAEKPHFERIIQTICNQSEKYDAGDALRLQAALGRGIMCRDQTDLHGGMLAGYNSKCLWFSYNCLAEGTTSVLTRTCTWILSDVMRKQKTCVCQEAGCESAVTLRSSEAQEAV